jgi:hypothetical protein
MGQSPVCEPSAIRGRIPSECRLAEPAMAGGKKFNAHGGVGPMARPADAFYSGWV